MAESNVLAESSKRPLGRRTLLQACQLYQDRHADAQERVPATFQLLMMAAWSPGPGQPKPLRRGSGQASLADILGS